MFQAWPLRTASCFANMRSWKSSSLSKRVWSSFEVSCHHFVEVRRGMKWSRVFCEKGWPMRETGRKSQPLFICQRYDWDRWVQWETSPFVGMFPGEGEGIVDCANVNVWGIRGWCAGWRSCCSGSV